MPRTPPSHFSTTSPAQDVRSPIRLTAPVLNAGIPIVRTPSGGGVRAGSEFVSREHPTTAPLVLDPLEYAAGYTHGAQLREAVKAYQAALKAGAGVNGFLGVLHLLLRKPAASIQLVAPTTSTPAIGL